jgi:MFS_1 like family
LLAACVLLPPGEFEGRAAAAADLRRLVRKPGFLAFVAAAGLLQASHALYYGFATLHWRAAGHGELVIGLLSAEGVVAEVALFAWAAALLRRFPPIRLLALAGALTVARWAASALSTDLLVLVPAQALHAASFGAVHLAAIARRRSSTQRSGLLRRARHRAAVRPAHAGRGLAVWRCGRACVLGDGSNCAGGDRSRRPPQQARAMSS